MEGGLGFVGEGGRRGRDGLVGGRDGGPVHPLSCCSLEQCVGRRPLCGRSGRTGIFQLLPGVSGGMGEGGGCEGRSLS